MLHHPPQQRIGGGAVARNHSRTSSITVSSAERAYNPGPGLDSLSNSLENVPSSPDDFGISDKDSPTESSFDTSSQQGGHSRGGLSSRSTADGSAPQPSGVAIPPVGFPPRPARYTAEKGPTPWPTSADTGSLSKADAKSQSFDPPAESLVYPQSKPTDFNPWIGNHIEDSLTEQTVKTGFQNKPSITSESNTARPALWTHLKNKSGIQALSSLFVAIIEKRQASGRLLVPSTFKPPPRVSLTNTKREAWLTELANPACAMRRFNRTIPYGINGKGILEQCLDKEIPIARAIWLAKCIGANELRTLKRKGVAGAHGISAELKWIREWTMHVEQFLEATLAGCGDQAWTARIQYVIRLSYHLYLEQLLDEDYFLDWVLSSFEASASERLPLWLIHVQLYWRFLVCNRKRGRRLAGALCAYLQNDAVDQEKADLLEPVVHKLQILIGTLTVSHKGCMIMPKNWKRYEPIVQNIAFRAELRSGVQSIVERNNRLAEPIWSQGGISASSPHSRALRAFDEHDVEASSLDDICGRLWDITGSVEAVVNTALEWCSSMYRQGAYRVYLASHLLRRCRLSGADIESYILSFLGNPPNAASLDVCSITKVVAELVRSKHFAASRVLQSVIARGAMTDSEHNPQTAARLRQLVQDIPTMGLAQNVEDLQRILLESARCPMSLQDEAVTTIEALLQRLMAKNSGSLLALREEVVPKLESLTLASKYTISLHMRQEIVQRNAQLNRESDMQRTDPARPKLTCHDFYVAREVMEQLEDYPVLADVVGICIRNSNPEMLASAIDTIRYHRQCFAAIGALRPLTVESTERYQVLRRDLSPGRACISSLLGLLMRGSDVTVVQQLKYDLARCDQQNGMAMSPASDNALDTIGTHSMNSDEEMERILSGGTTMDEQSMARIFHHLTSLLAALSKTYILGDWFSRLRIFDDSTFDGLMRNWLHEFLQDADADVCRQALPVILRSDIVPLAAFEKILSESQEQLASGDVEVQIKLAGIGLKCLLLPETGQQVGGIIDQYKYKLEQDAFRRQYPAATLRYFRHALDLVDDESASPSMAVLRTSLRHPAIRYYLLDSAIKHRALLQSDVMSIASSGGGASAGRRVLKEILNTLLDPKGQYDASAFASQAMIPQLVRMADELSLPICQIEMQMLLNGDTQNTSIPTHDLASSLFDAIIRSPDSDRPPWIQLMVGLDRILLQRLRSIAETHILKIVNECFPRFILDTAHMEQSPLSKINAALRKFLCIVDCTVSAQETSSQTPAITSESENLGLDRFGAIKDVLTRHFLPEADVGAPGFTISANTRPMLDALLHLLVVKKLASDGHKITPGEVASILPTLFSILTQDDLEKFPGSCELLYDTIIYLSDDLNDEYRALLVKSELPKYPKDTRILFILGSPHSGDAWIGLVTSNPAASAGPAGATPQTPAARFGAQQQSNARLQQQPPRPPTPQRTNTSQAQQKSFNPPVPYPLRRWELLPDQGSSTTANDTSISLSLFDARKA